MSIFVHIRRVFVHICRIKVRLKVMEGVRIRLGVRVTVSLRSIFVHIHQYLYTFVKYS